MKEELFMTFASAGDGDGLTFDIHKVGYTMLEEIKSNVLALIYWSRWTEESLNMIIYVRRSVSRLKSLMTVIDVHKQGLTWRYIAWCKVPLGPHVRWYKCMCI